MDYVGMFIYQLWGRTKIHPRIPKARRNNEPLHPSVLQRGMMCVDPDKPRLRTLTGRIPKA